MRPIALKATIIAGMALVVVGVWSIYWPAGCIALGAAFLVVGLGST